MNTRFVGIGELACSREAQDNLVTLGLGSCVALVVAQPSANCGALAHIALPCASWDQGAKQNRPPAFYADQAVQTLFDELNRLPGFNPIFCEVSLVGGAECRKGARIQVGNCNVEALLQALEQKKISPKRQLTGGNTSRNVRLEISSGTIWVKEPDAPETKL